MEIGFSCVPRELSTNVELARASDAAGVGWFGLADSPYLYQEVHAAIQDVLRGTSSIRVGTFVTNPVTRHWSVQAAAFRTLDELAPGRVFMGIAPGDSAVHSVGLRPAKPSELASYLEKVRKHLPESVEVMVAAGGPRSVRQAAAYADHLVLGQGASLEVIELLSALADSSREEAGRAPVQKWLFLIFNLAERESRRAEVRADIRSTVVAFSRNAFDFTYESKAVSPELQQRLAVLYRDYSFEEHSKPGASRNAQLLETVGSDVEGFLFDRFALVDVPEAAAERLLGLSEATGIDRFFLCIETSDPLKTVRLAGERMMPRLPI